MLKKGLDKRNRMTRSGAVAVNLPKFQYFDQMAFLFFFFFFFEIIFFSFKQRAKIQIQYENIKIT